MTVVRPARPVAPVMRARKGGAIVDVPAARAFEPGAVLRASAVFRAGLAA